MNEVIDRYRLADAGGTPADVAARERALAAAADHMCTLQEAMENMMGWQLGTAVPDAAGEEEKMLACPVCEDGVMAVRSPDGAIDMRMVPAPAPGGRDIW